MLNQWSRVQFDYLLCVICMHTVHQQLSSSSSSSIQLKVRMMPTVVIFNVGVAVDKIIGFEGMGDRMPEGQEDSFPTIFLARFALYHVD